MKTLWLIEKDLYEEEREARIKKALVDNGVQFKMVSFYGDGGMSSIERILKEASDTIVFPYGCIQFIKWIANANKTVKADLALFVDWKKFSYLYYSAYWGKYLLNQRCVATSYAELIRQKDFFFSIMGAQDAIFVRPVGNDKTFTGRLLYKESFDTEILRLGHNFIVGFDPHLEVVVAEPVNVVKEWRFAIINGEVISSTLYNINGMTPENQPECDNERVMALAAEVAKDPWQPEDCYVLDICETKGGDIKVLEMGGINCASWYGMDYQKIVAGIEKWKAKYETEGKDSG